MQVIDIKGKPRVFSAPKTCIINAKDGVLIDGERVVGSVILEAGAEVKVSGKGELVVYSSSLDEIEVRYNNPKKNQALLSLITAIHDRVQQTLSHENVDSALVDLTLLSIDLENAKTGILTTQTPEKLV